MELLRCEVLAGLLSVDELDSPMRERIEAVPTRLTLEADQVDVAIQGARDSTLALRRLRTYLRDRVAPGGRKRHGWQRYQSSRFYARRLFALHSEALP